MVLVCFSSPLREGNLYFSPEFYIPSTASTASKKSLVQTRKLFSTVLLHSLSHVSFVYHSMFFQEGQSIIPFTLSYHFHSFYIWKKVFLLLSISCQFSVVVSLVPIPYVFQFNAIYKFLHILYITSIASIVMKNDLGCKQSG